MTTVPCACFSRGGCFQHVCIRQKQKLQAKAKLFSLSIKAADRYEMTQSQQKGFGMTAGCTAAYCNVYGTAEYYVTENIKHMLNRT